MKKRIASFLLLVIFFTACSVREQDNRSLEITPEVQLTDQDSWYQSPMFAVMTGFIYQPLVDYTTREWEKNLGNSFDADKFTRQLKESNVDYLIFYDKWIDGFVFHDTKTTDYKTSRDFIRDVSEGCRKNDVNLILYYNAISDGNPEFIESAARDRFGNIIPFHPIWPTNYATLHHPGFRKKSLAQLEELFSQYQKLDGIWFDIYSERLYARNQCVKDAFSMRFNKPIAQATREELLLLESETVSTYMKDARTIADKYQDDAVFTYNGSLVNWFAGYKHRANHLNPQLQYWMRETNSMDVTEFESRRAHFSPKPIEMGSLINSTWFTPLHDTIPPLGRKSNNHVIAEVASGMCRGATVYLALTPNHAGEYGADLEAVKEAGKWVQSVKPYLNHSKPYANVGVILGTPSLDAENFTSKNTFWNNFRQTQISPETEAMSICEDLENAGYFSQILYAYADYTNWPESLSQFNTIILPEHVELDEKHLQKIRDYVQNGGKCIAFGHSTLLDETGQRLPDHALADLFGIQNRGGILASPAPVDFDADLKQQYFCNVEFETFDEKMNVIVSPDAKVIAKGDQVILNKYGEGESYYFATGEAAFRGNTGFWSGLCKMAGSEPGLEFHNPPSHRRGGVTKTVNRYVVVMNETSQGRVLHIIDRQATSSTVELSLLSEIIGDASKAIAIETGEEMDLIKNGERSILSVTVDPVVSLLFK